MKFNEKLQILRKQKGLTQEELAKTLYVSRTAISKWESDRGYPNIDSLKAIANLFSITIDELVSGNELLTIAEEDNKEREKNIRNLVFGLLDLSVLTFFFLPLFGQNVNGIIQEVSLLSLTEITPYLRIAYYIIVAIISLWGILTIALQNFNNKMWIKNKIYVSLLFNVIGVFIYIISLQPYAAILLFLFLLIKVLILINKR